MASIELRTPKNKPAYYKITASITLNGQTIRKFSRFEFDPKTLKTAKQRVAAATAAAFEFEAKAQEEAERSLSGANKPFQEVAEEYIASAKAKLEPAALLRLIEQPQQIKLVISAQVTVVDRSAVDERKMPVMPMNEPQMELRNSAPM